jgi:hypothetical protein
MSEPPQVQPHFVVVTNEKSTPVGPKKKFTPENIRQISNLVEKGKSRDEIAEIIGVTPGTLAVTCSKLGISLRRSHFDSGRGRLRVASAHLQNSNADEQRRGNDYLPTKNHEGGICQATETTGSTTLGGEKSTPWKAKKPPVANLTIIVGYKGEERETELTPGHDVLGRLALEAEFRGIKLLELIERIIVGTVEKDLFQEVLERRREG